MATSEGLKFPDPMEIGEDLLECWENFFSEYEIYTDIVATKNKDKNKEKSTFLYCLGKVARGWMKTIGVDEEDDCETMIEKIKEHCERTNVETLRDYNLWSNANDQKQGESFDSYYERIKSLAKKCRFGDVKYESRSIRSRLIIGLQDKSLQCSLISENVTLNDLVQKCRAREAGNIGLQQIQRYAQKESFENQVANVRKYGDNRNFECRACGLKHTRGACPAFRQTCNACGRMGHFAKKCFTPQRYQSRPFRGNKIHAITETLQEMNHPDEDKEHYEICAIKKIVNGEDKWSQVIEINGTALTVKIDTGADVSILPRYEIIKINEITGQVYETTDHARLVSYFGEKRISKSTAVLKVCHKEKSINEKFRIMEEKVQPTLSGDAAEALGLIKRVSSITRDRENEEWMERYESVFNGMGHLKDFECRIQLVENYTPKINPCRSIPIAMEARVKKEIDRMLNLGIIIPMEEYTEFVSNIVVVPKSEDKVRICLDPLYLNKCIERDSYPMKTLDRIRSKLFGAKFFTKLDACEGFWQVPLETNSIKLCTFITPWGKFAFTRMPYGIKCASDVFQNISDQLFRNMEGVESSIDDLVVWGKTKEEHDERVTKVLQRCKEAGLVLNKKKCQFLKDKVKFLGHWLTRDGIIVDDERIEDIMNIESPKNKQDIMKFLGSINFVREFIINLSDQTKALRELIKKDVEFIWEDRHEEAFKSLKQSLTEMPVLSYFNRNEKIELSVDASQYGMGAMISQNKHPIAYASRSLTETQQRYAQIEKEMYAIVFGCTKFHDYIYGQKEVTVWTDHRPLEMIFNKPLNQVPMRLQRMRMELQKYDIVVKYTPGTSIPIPDFLSRYPSVKTFPNELNVFGIVECLPIKDRRLNEFIKLSSEDEELKELKKICEKGWPTDKEKVHIAARCYWPYRDEIHSEIGLVLRSNRIIVPRCRRKEILGQLHVSHPGINKMTLRAQDSVYWPNINKDIEQFVQTCAKCQRFQNQNCKEPMITSEIPELPWSTVHADLFEFNGKQFLIVVDTYSFYFEIVPLNYTTSSYIIKALFSTFQRFGIPITLKTDNGPQFKSFEFKRTMEQYAINHVTSSPYHPAGNSYAERAVQEAKKILRKVQFGTPEYFVALMEWRNTPRNQVLGSPNQRMMNRVVRGILPTTTKHLQPRLIAPDTVKSALQKSKEQQKDAYDNKAHELSKLKNGQKVLIRSPISKTWSPGRVENEIYPRSYEVVDDNGNKYRKNRIDLKNRVVNRENEAIHGDTSRSRHETSYLENAKVDRQPEDQLNHSTSDVHYASSNAGQMQTEDEDMRVALWEQRRQSTPITQRTSTRIRRPNMNNDFVYY